jgi:hypothetical protein
MISGVREIHHEVKETNRRKITLPVSEVECVGRWERNYISTVLISLS